MSVIPYRGDLRVGTADYSNDPINALSDVAKIYCHLIRLCNRVLQHGKCVFSAQTERTQKRPFPHRPVKRLSSTRPSAF